MKNTLNIGDSFTQEYVAKPARGVPSRPSLPAERTETALLDANSIAGLVELCCNEAFTPHLEAGEISVSNHTSLNYFHPALSGSRITVSAACSRVDRDGVMWSVSAHDGVSVIAQGLHRCRVVELAEFESEVRRKIVAEARANPPLGV
jgi:predicted thioesterase